MIMEKTEEKEVMAPVEGSFTRKTISLTAEKSERPTATGILAAACTVMAILVIAVIIYGKFVMG